MKYISTRGGHIDGVSSAYAIKTGLASDGGLFMPYEIPSIDLGFIDEISKLSYPEMAAKVLSLFIDAGVEVIRIGLQAGDGLCNKDSYVAGPNHPAIGELIIGEYYYEKIMDILSEAKFAFDEHITVLVKRGELSKAIGQNAKNKTRLKAMYKNIRFAESDGLKKYDVSVTYRNGEIKCI